MNGPQCRWHPLHQTHEPRSLSPEPSCYCSWLRHENGEIQAIYWHFSFAEWRVDKARICCIYGHFSFASFYCRVYHPMVIFSEPPDRKISLAIECRLYRSFQCTWQVWQRNELFRLRHIIITSIAAYTKSSGTSDILLQATVEHQGKIKKANRPKIVIRSASPGLDPIQ